MGNMEKEDWQKRAEGHRQRLRERFMKGGLERFSDEEVVEFLLTLGTPRKDVKPAAREALKRFGSLSEVLSAPMEKLTEIKGIGQKNALYLNLAHQVAGRYLRDRARGKGFQYIYIGPDLQYSFGQCKQGPWLYNEFGAQYGIPGHV